jgi:hypothetical protein
MKKLISVLAIVALSVTLFAVNTQAVKEPTAKKIAQETTTEYVALTADDIKKAFNLNEHTSYVVTRVEYNNNNSLQSKIFIKTSESKVQIRKPGLFSKGGTFTPDPTIGKHSLTIQEICLYAANDHSQSNVIVVPKSFKRIEVKNGTVTKLDSGSISNTNFAGESLDIIIKCIKQTPKTTENKGFVGSKRSKTQIATRKTTKTAPKIA